MPDIRFLHRLTDMPAADWDALHDGRNPFVSHAFLQGLEEHGCLRAEWGWRPRHFTLWESGQLIGAVPGYLKDNSHGEFVFDHAWANAYARHGLAYFPKWLGAVPYSPVSGPRLLAKDAETARMLVETLRAEVARMGWSSAHVNFHLAEDDPAFGPDWLLREDIQFQWHNPGNWPDFSSFLAAMDHKHRKNIRQERAKLARTGVSYRIVHGDEATDADLQAMHDFYLQTFSEYGNSPALTLPFLQHLATAMPRQLVIFLAMLEGQPIAGALCLRGGDTLYGRYWGGATLPGLHFETCYYQGIEYCLREGLARFEPGAQGEHKLARGFLPHPVRSRHWLAEPAFAAALAGWCAQEREEVQRYAQLLAEHTPFKAIESA
ncbi:GNAT family N-acetyltransferase [Stenotrophomonas sp. SORGH_AS_0282]|jgi:predicted N-acyltransferase|uniref:GNAT family N-acetyltransferase n=1 Tax=Stenotrophomonas sp. SORGH_AS_0282 TaxID=3041763 RepID=UPI0027826B1A|nr:GNAT family N-acetyltransferase [Stenotrophomonas sp. SORGH_AS_0282]MDQ1062726.1 putative N-acyltransferase [Stenotrophomonas sp. SORGH_AS_0282]MDQ1188920.1 putative N-acyltransferase [Stenotrophomonas sp. SORGH_AS_0282]